MKKIGLSTALALGLALPACGGNSDDTHPSQPPTAPPTGTVQPDDVERDPVDVHDDVTRLPIINEFVIDHFDADTHEYVEILGVPETDHSDYAVVAVDGDRGADGDVGRIEAILSVGETDENGLWSEFQSRLFPGRGTQTLLLVRGLAEGTAVGDDVDADDDGKLDAGAPWAEVYDAVAVADRTGEDETYAGTAVLGKKGFDSLKTRPGGASRIPNGKDTDAPSDWVRNDFLGAGLPIGGAEAAPAEFAHNTPGLPNAVGPQDSEEDDSDEDDADDAEGDHSDGDDGSRE